MTIIKCILCERKDVVDEVPEECFMCGGELEIIKDE